jgi:malyl-CoA/(S)-citramalyl-CoA lyase
MIGSWQKRTTFGGLTQSGAGMPDGKMQDDATGKQAKVVVDLAKIAAGKDSEMAAKYGM